MMAVPMLTSAAELKTGREYTVQKDVVVKGDVYIAAQTSVIAGDVQGDLAVVGANVLITGTIEQDLIAAGGTISVLGDVGDDVRAAGGTITIGQDVKGDVVAAGGVVHIISGAIVDGDVLVAAGQVIVDGVVNGKIRVAGGEVIINGSVGKGVEAQASKSVSIGKDAIISGSLIYRSTTEAVIAEGATIQGGVDFEKIDFPKRVDKRMGAAMIGLISAMALMKMISAVLIAVLSVLFFKKTIQVLVDTTTKQYGKEILRGFIILIVTPVAVIITLISIVGIGIGTIGGLMYALLLVMAKVFAGILLGVLIMKAVKKAKEFDVTWQNAAIGVVAIEIIKIVPVIGWLFVFLLFLASLGSISLMVYQRMWLKK